LAGAGAYLFWGVFPLYFLLIAAASPMEVIAYRISCSLVFSLAAAAITGQLGALRALLHERRTFWVLAGAGVLVASNWTIYVWAVLAGHVVDAALGYFVNPLLTALLAVVFLKEKLRPLQIAALSLGALAVLVISVGYGQIPWVALLLALTFGFYGLIKKQVSASVSPLVGLTVETLPITPLALGYIFYLQSTGAGTLLHSPVHTAALLSAGIVTAVPLLLYATAAGRIPLSTLGLLQYICPVGQFLLGVLVFAEQMPPARWAGFALIWVALCVLTWDLLRGRRTVAA
jgi:chloramphenicol-sensitive protein RarD